MRAAHTPVVFALAVAALAAGPALAARNKAPVVDESAFDVDEDKPLSAEIKAHDPEGDALSFRLKKPPKNGTVELQPNGKFTYTPHKDFHGRDEWVFEVSDGKARTTHKAIIAVSSVNDPPVAPPLTLSGTEDKPVRGDVGAKDADGDPLSYAVGKEPARGSVDIDAHTGRFTFTPADDDNGTVDFTIRVSDGTTNVKVPVTVKIAAVNDAPSLREDKVDTKEDQPLKEKFKAHDVDKDPITFTIIERPKHGTVTVDAGSASYLYTPAKDYAGDDGFRYAASDGKATSRSAVEISVHNVNDPPTLTAASVTGEEDQPAKTRLVAKDPDGDQVYYALKSDPKHGDVDIDHETGELTYKPAHDWFGTDTFTVEASDTSAGMSAPVTVTIKPVNDAPVTAASVHFDGDEDKPLDGKLKASDVDKDALTFSLVKAPRRGGVDLKADGTFRYTPRPNENGDDAFSFRVSDGKAKAEGEAKITVKPENDAPTTHDVAVSTREDSAVRGVVRGEDIDKDKLSYTLGTLSKKGKVEVDEVKGAFVYTPNPNENGDDSFGVTVSDGSADVEAKVSVSIAAVNDAPVAAAHDASGKEDEPIKGSVGGSDVDKDTLTFRVVQQPRSGKLELDAQSGAYTYTPRENFNGDDGFRFEVSDGKLRDGGAVKLSVAAVNDAPEVKAVKLAVTEDRAESGSVPASDVDKDKLTWSEAKPPAKGTVKIDAATGRFTYTPNKDENGEDSFVVAVSDGAGGTTSGVVSVAIAPVNDAPVASAHDASGKEDTPIKDSVGGSDVDKDTLTFRVVQPPRFGKLELDAQSGAYTYTPRENENGDDSFRFEVSDGKLRDRGAVKLTVAAVNDAPDVKAVKLSVTEDRAEKGSVPASDVDKDKLTWSVANAPKKGKATIDAESGRFTYTPNKDENGDDDFMVAVSDGTATTQVPVSVAIAPVNDAPVAVAHDASGKEDTPIKDSVGGSDVDKDTLTWRVVQQPRSGTIELDAQSGAYTYTPRANTNGEDGFRFEVSDGKLRDTGAVKLTVAAVNDAPVTKDVSVSTREDRTASSRVTASDVDKDVLTFRVKKPPQHGDADVDADDGTLHYTPAADWNGEDSFVVAVSDGFLEADATVKAAVAPEPDAPVVDLRPLETAEDEHGSLTLTAVDPDGDDVTFRVVTQARIGAAEVESDGKTLLFTPKPDENGEDRLVLEASDGKNRVRAVLPVLVAPRNDPPTVDDASLKTLEERPVTLALSAHDKDGDPVTLTLDKASVKKGTADVSLAGSVLRVAPAKDFAGTLEVKVIPSDPSGPGAPGKITVTVENVNDAPVVKDTAVRAAPGKAVSGRIAASDVDAGDELTFSVAVPPRHGTVKLDDPRTGAFTFTAGTDARGEDSFRIRVKDKAGASAVAVVHVSVGGGAVSTR